MASGTRLARLKKLEDVNALTNKNRKLDKVPDKSSLNKKLEITEKILESPLRKTVKAEIVESPISTNSKKHGRPIVYKSRKEDGSVGPSSNSDKANKGASQLTKKRKAEGSGVSSTAEKSTMNASPQKKNRNGAKNVDLGANATKSENNGKKTMRKHLHVRTYRKFVRRQSSKGGNQGPDISKQKDERDEDNKRCDALDKRDPVAETIKSLDKEDLKKTDQLVSDLDSDSPRGGVNEENVTKFSGSKNRRRVLSDILKDPSEKKTPAEDQCAVNIELPTSIREEAPGASNSGAHYEACPEGNSNIDSEQCTTHSQAASDLISNTCLICKQPGQLLCCFGKGCQRSYHLSCLGPYLPGAWLCNFCVKRKVDSGVYSVFEGIESVWDIDEGAQSGKHYFVKFKGLSHTHNRWISESQLLHDAPSLLAKFRKKCLREKVTKWNKKWTEPERLLKKRLVLLPDSSDECTSRSVTESSNCCIEWFVKWKGLDYDQATWELQSSEVLRSSDAAKLISDYEFRCELARRSSDPQRVEMALRTRKDPFFRLTGLPDGCPAVLGDDLLGSLNCLRGFWHRSVNAVLIDDQERLTKSIVFLLSLQCHACRPSLIITTSGSLPLWHAEFVRLAPSLNVVMYQGDKDIRKMIMNLEFYEESGSLMFQVLLAESCALMEDFSDIACIGWEAVVIDKCEKSKISRYLEQLRSLSTYFKLLLFDGQLKDNISEYHFLLSLLGTGGTADNGLTSVKDDTKEALGALATAKERLARHIAYECKADSSNLVEYWVPAPFSNVQLEQFCSAFISNSSVLRSNSRSDVVGALHNILITSRKCCDHPYLVDGELRGLLTKGLQATDFLNAEVRASGKLFLLDKILQEMRNRELRVVILFQSLGGHGKISLGDILDDFLQQRFGVDSYERIESGLVRTKKLASLKMFNNKEGGRFVFLIEKRACVPSVKLRFVDAVILFDSDWNPLNDLRSLQKISIESQDNCIKVFRLYTSFTVEEKLLMLVKQDTLLDSNIDNISRNVAHSMLGWGASYLFHKLDQFHSSTRETCISEPSFDRICVNDVISEILTEIPGKFETTVTSPHSILIKAQQGGAIYSGNNALVGEKEEMPLPDIPSFWTELLEGRYPRWVHISDRSQRIRRKVYNVDGFVKRNEVENDEMKKKRRKTNIVIPAPSLKCSQEKIDSPKGAEPKIEEQRNLLILLRPELSELSDVLGLPVSVKGKAQEFLLYITTNLDVCSKQVTLLQALKISLCWRAAKVSMYKLDRVESFVLARRHLNYACTEEETYSVYKRLRILKDKFPNEASKFDKQSDHPRKMDSEREPPSGRSSETAASDISGLSVIGCAPESSKTSREPFSRQNGRLIPEDSILKSQIDLIEKTFLQRSEDLAHKQHAEVLHFEEQTFEERVKLEKAHGLNLDLIRSIHIDLKVLNGKINLLTQEYSTKMDKFSEHLKQQKEKLLSLQLDIRNREKVLKQSLLVKAKAGQLKERFDNIPLLQTGFKLEKFKEIDNYINKCNYSGTIVLNSEHPSDEENTEVVILPAVESNESEECCLDVQSDILNGSEENILVSDENYVSQIVTADNMKSRTSVELLWSSENRTQSEDMDRFSEQTEFVNASIMSPIVDRENQAGRENSNQDPSLFSGQALASSVPASTSLHIQELFTNQHERPVVDANSRNQQGLDCSHEVTMSESVAVVAMPPPIELIHCNDATSLNFANWILDDCDQSASLGPYCSIEQTEIPAQCTIMEPLTVRIPENSVQTAQDLLERSHTVDLQGTGIQTAQDLLERSRTLDLQGTGIQTAQDLLERSRTVDLQGTGFQQEVAHVDQLLSTQQTVVPEILGAAMETARSNQQNMENSLHQSRSQEDLPSESAPFSHLRTTGLPPDQGNQLFRNLMSTGWIPPQAFFPDPFQNELLRIRKQDDTCAKKYEERKLRIQLEREVEIEKVRRKYDTVLQYVERESLRDKSMFQAIYDKVYLHKVFAEDIRCKYYDLKDGSSTAFQGQGQNPPHQLPPAASQPPFRPSSVPITVPPSTASSLHPTALTLNQESSGPPLALPRSRTRIPSLASIHSSGSIVQPSPIFPSNNVRGSTARPMLQVGRAPAPHLQRFRSSTLAPTTNPSLPSAAFVPMPPAPSSDLGCSISQTTSSDPQPSVNSPRDIGVDILESLLLDIQPSDNEHLGPNTFDSRPTGSQDIICLSDDD